MTTLLALALLMPPATTTGWASAYAPGVMEATVRYRLDNDVWRRPLPPDWYTVAGYVAAMDCSRVGEVATLVDPAGDRHRVLIADCAGADGPPDRFDKRNIIVELDAGLWQRLTMQHGRPLRVTLEAGARSYP